MKILKYVIVFAALSITSLSCKKIEDLQKDPAAIYDASPKLLLTGILLNSYDGPWGADQRNNQYMVLNEAYYGNQAYTWTTGSFDADYTQIRNAVRLEIEAQKIGDLGLPYIALAKFFKAYFFIRASDMFGDVPMSEALKGVNESVFKPKYDQQKDVYIQTLTLLDEANAELTTLIQDRATVEGDFFYSGNLGKWQKLVNSFKLRVLISLSKRADDTPDLTVKQQFATIVNDPTKYPLILSVEDNFQLVYNSTAVSNNYPLWPSDGNVIKSDLRNNLGATYIDILKKTNDPRLLVVALPTDSARNSGDQNFATQFTSYRGGETGELQTTLKDQAIAGKLSTINFDYWISSPSGVPCVQFGAYETHLSIAEAINRGWISSGVSGIDAAEHYNRGVKESMAFYGVDSDAESFMTLNPYAGNNAAGLEQILEQKYVAFFQNSGRQAYYNYRRTGIPAFDIGPSNGNNNSIPVRWAYPTSEYSVNSESLISALQSQFGGADTQNGVIWLIK